MLATAAALAADPEDVEIEPPVPSLTSSAMSISRRFLATGGTSTENAEWAAWAEEVADRCSEAIGWQPFFQRGDPLVVALRDSARYPGGRAIAAQSLDGGRLRQKLILYGPKEVDPEEALEALCSLLLSRYVFERQGAAAPVTEPVQMPDWLSVGFAQNLYPALRARNSRMMWRAWEKGVAPSFESLLEQASFPEGRWLEKAAAGVACALWLSWPHREARWGALFDRLARGERVAAEWLATEGAGLASVAELEQCWDLWLASRGRVRTDWNTVTSEDLEALREAMRVDAELLRLVGWENAPEALPPELLVDRRGEPWMPTLALFVGFRVRQLALGRAAPFQSVVAQYAAFWDALARGRRWLGPSRGRLLRMLAEADAALAALDADVQSRESAGGEAKELWPRVADAVSQDASEPPVVLPAIRIVPAPSLPRRTAEAAP